MKELVDKFVANALEKIHIPNFLPYTLGTKITTSNTSQS